MVDTLTKTILADTVGSNLTDFTFLITLDDADIYTNIGESWGKLKVLNASATQLNCLVEQWRTPRTDAEDYASNGDSSLITASTPLSGTYPATKMFDGSILTGTNDRYVSAAGAVDTGTDLITNTWIQWDFGERETIGYFRLHYNAYAGRSTIGRFDVYISNTGEFDGEEIDVGEVTITGITVDGWSDWMEFPAPTEGRYLKIIPLEVHAGTAPTNYFQIGEMEFAHSLVPFEGKIHVKGDITSASDTEFTVDYTATNSEDFTYIRDALAASYEMPLTSNFNNGLNRNIRLKLPAAFSSDLSGATLISLLFPRVSFDWTFASCYIGKKGTGSYDFDGNQVEVLFGGSSGKTITEDTTSDAVSFSIEDGETYIISFHITTINQPRHLSAGGCTAYYLVSATDYSDQTTQTGYSTSTAKAYGVELITAIADISSVVDTDTDLLITGGEDIKELFGAGVGETINPVFSGTINQIVDSNYGRAYELDGVDGKIDLGGLSATAAWTFSALINPASLANDDGIFVIDGDGIVVSDGRFAALDNNDVSVDGSAVVNDTFIHVAVTSDTPLDSDTKLLIHSDTTDGSVIFTDLSPSEQTINVGAGTVHHEIDQSKFGATSIYFDGTTGVQLSIPGTTDFNFGTDDFTIDFWRYLVANSNAHGLYDSGWTASDALLMQAGSGGNEVSVWVGGSNVIPACGAQSLDTWHHIALVKYSGTLYLYIDGVLIDSVANSTSIGGSYTTYIGCRVAGSYPLNGYYDEYRVTKGLARWTANFTPPTVSYLVAGKLYEDGVEVGASATDTGWGLSSVAQIGLGQTGQYAGMQIKAIFKSSSVRSADWIEAMYLSAIGQLFGVPSGTLLRATLEQVYDLLAADVRALLLQQYAMMSGYRASLDQLYGIRLLAAVSQLYGDMYAKRTVLDQNYGEYADLRNVLVQLYGDADKHRQMVEQEWSSFEGLRQIFEQRYSVSDHTVRGLVANLYDLSERDRVRQMVDHLYVLAAGEALIQATAVVITAVNGSDERPITSAYNVNVEQDEGTFYMVGELKLADQNDFAYFIHLETETTIIIDGESYIFVPLDPKINRRGQGNEYIVPLVSKTMLLDHSESAYSVVTDQSLTGMAKSLVEYLALGVATVDWQMIDWFIPDKILYVAEETTIGLIKRIVNAAGGVVQTTPAGVLLCRPEYITSVDVWDATSPDYSLTDQDDFFQISPQEDQREGFNTFFISDETVGADGLVIEEEQLSARQRRVKVYMVPWDDSYTVNLQHSGGSWVVVSREGIKTSQEVEQVEFKLGAGKTIKPVYGSISVDFNETDLGGVDVDEDGNLTAATAENSLAVVTYTTKYHSFIVTDDEIEDVQVYPELVDV